MLTQRQAFEKQKCRYMYTDPFFKRYTCVDSKPVEENKQFKKKQGVKFDQMGQKSVAARS